MNKSVLIIGNGGRENSIGSKLANEGCVLYFAPGNPGTAKLGQNVPIAHDDIPALVDFALSRNIDLVIVGPEAALAVGLVNALMEAGVRVFGPIKSAAQIETSKAFAKDMMRISGVPTANYRTFSSFPLAKDHIKRIGRPCAIKASGLAGGKGSWLCRNQKEADEALERLMCKRVYGDAGEIVVVEDLLDGFELSAHVIASGKQFVPFPFVMDHKHVGEGDTGSMTGSMGAVSVNLPQYKHEVDEKVVVPILDTMAANHLHYCGCLFPGIMVTENGLMVLEFNARFGDPEIQVHMMRMESDLLPLLEAAIDGTLDMVRVDWRPGAAACIILAQEGYPDDPKIESRQVPITGIEQAESIPDVAVFHAGTAMKDGHLVTNGGRVLGVTAYADNLADALVKAYQASGLIHFDGKYCRGDIGKKALKLMAV